MKLIIDIGLAISFTLAFVTGLVKFPLILETLEVNQSELPMYELSVIHDYSALIMGILILSHLVFNFKWMINVTKKKLRKANKSKLVSRSIVVFVIFILIFVTLNDPAVRSFLFGPENSISIEGIGDFEYNPNKIESVRPDIFKPGHFSIFDILVYLDSKNKIDLEYHFDETMNTNMIDSINGKSNWWYLAYYDGGWPESNVFRMDHYPYKEKISIEIFRESSGTIQNIYNTFRAEVNRLEANSGEVIIPEVIIRGKRSVSTFQDLRSGIL